MLGIVLFTAMILAGYSSFLVKFYNANVKDIITYIFLVCLALLLVFTVSFFAICAG